MRSVDGGGEGVGGREELNCDSEAFSSPENPPARKVAQWMKGDGRGGKRKEI